MIGNLLSAGFLQDKIGSPETVTTILGMLNPKVPRQFVAVAYCLSQIAQTRQSTEVVVRSGSIAVIAGLLNVVSEVHDRFKENPLLFMAGVDGGEGKGTVDSSSLLAIKDGVSFLWGIISNLVTNPLYFKVCSTQPYPILLLLEVND